jgi:hypothetical protein
MRAQSNIVSNEEDQLHIYVFQKEWQADGC